MADDDIVERLTREMARTALPKPGVPEPLITPEIVQEPPPIQCPGCERGERHCDASGLLLPGHTALSCPGCETGLTPHFAPATGRLNKGHNRPNNSGKTSPTDLARKVAIETLHAAAPKAAAVLIAGLDDGNPWVRNASATRIIDKVMPPEALHDPASLGPALIFPPGTKMLVMIPEQRERLAVPAPDTEDEQ